MAFKFAKVLKAFDAKYGVIYSDNKTNTTVCQIKTGAIFNDSHELYDHFEELMGGNFGNENLLKRYTWANLYDIIYIMRKCDRVKRLAVPP